MSTGLLVLLAVVAILAYRELSKRWRKAQQLPSKRRASETERSYMGDTSEMHKLVAFVAAITGYDHGEPGFADIANRRPKWNQLQADFASLLRRFSFNLDAVCSDPNERQRMISKLSTNERFLSLCREHIALITDVHHDISRTLNAYGQLTYNDRMPTADTVQGLYNTYPKRNNRP